MRRTLGLAVLLAVPLVGAQAADAATTLYPDLQTLPPRSFKFDDNANVNPDPSGTPVNHHVLRFTNTVWNAGAGKLEITSAPVPPNPPAGSTYPATQNLTNSDGTVTHYPVGSYFFHLQHNHYHYDDWGKYELWTKAAWDSHSAGTSSTARPTAERTATLSDLYAPASEPMLGQKTTSCMLDEEFITTLFGTPGGPNYSWAGCLPDGKGIIREGISPGWGDTYDYYRNEQWIDLGSSRLADGQYVLRSIADPSNKVYESPGKGDTSRESVPANQGIAVFTVRAGQVLDEQPPTGSVTINGVAASTTSPNVTVRVVGRDDVSDLDAIRVSNNGSAWAELAFHPDPQAPSSPVAYAWNLADARYGGTPYGGVHTVYVQFHDTSGKWGAAVTDTIVMSGPPAPPAPGPGPTPTQFTLTVGKAGSGTVRSTPAGIVCGTTCKAQFAQGTVVTLVATPAKGSVFSGWSGPCVGRATCRLTINAATSVGAAFRLAPRGAVPPRPRAVRARLVRRPHQRRHVAVSWTARRGAQARFVVQRSTNGRRWVTVNARIGRNVRLYVDVLLRRPGRYIYRVRAVSRTGRASIWSNRAIVRYRR